MTELEKLKSFIADMFKDATEQADIEKAAALNNSIERVEEEVKEEQSRLLEQNAELIKSYKDLVKHTSFKSSEIAQDVAGDDLETRIKNALNQNIAKLK